jgi:SAM-dependent methyltransferase
MQGTGSASSPFEWSLAMERTFNQCVVEKVRTDTRTDWDENISLGVPFDVIRSAVIETGLADFSNGYFHQQYGNLTPEEKVLLYCFCNMKAHFFAAYKNFRLYRTSLSNLIGSAARPLCIDIGCGPGTAMLALHEALPSLKADWVGVDSAQPMLRKAREIWKVAVGCGLVHQACTARFHTSLHQVQSQLIAAKCPTSSADQLFFPLCQPFLKQDGCHRTCQFREVLNRAQKRSENPHRLYQFGGTNCQRQLPRV